MTNEKTKIELLAKDCIENWEMLMEDETFKAFYYLKITQTLNIDIDDIFEKALKTNTI
ncbi:hypothetical protein ACE939_04780 [Aquimarina sp. W85]|uniref:hypothetical protein n=1 Tax=Aquimarina rhodophyticola TaxID=3342246 RepID=UPI0036704307